MVSKIIRGTWRVPLIIFFIIGFNLISIGNQVSNFKEKYFLEIINPRKNKILIKIEVSIGDKFSLEYINSRDLNAIIDTFEIIEGETFKLLTEEYPWYGVGQEFHISQNIKFTDTMVIVNLNKKIKKLSLRVAFTVDQKIKFNGCEFILSNLIERGELVDIIIAKEVLMSNE